jgi:hypothetical protein
MGSAKLILVVEDNDAARPAVAERFGISKWQVRRNEQEGLDGNWPPVGRSGSRL